MGPKRGSEHPASCVIVRLEAIVIYDIDKTVKFISQGATEKPWGEEGGKMPGIVATANQRVCQHLT